MRVITYLTVISMNMSMLLHIFILPFNIDSKLIQKIFFNTSKVLLAITCYFENISEKSLEVMIVLHYQEKNLQSKESDIFVRD